MTARRLRPSWRRPVLVAVALACYAVLWLGFARHWHWLTTFDDAVVTWFYDRGVKHPLWQQLWDVICTVFGPDGFRLAAIVFTVVALSRRNLRAVLFLVLTIELSGLVTVGAKALADRARPATAMVAAASTSFPSGHALAVLAAVLALLTISGGHARAVWIALGALVVITVGVGRVVLNVHYPSDVLAGWALGYLWYLCCLVVVRPPPLTAAPDETRQAPDTER